MSEMKKVLIVDDSGSIRESIKSILAGKYIVIEGVDGMDGLRALEKNPDVSLVVCDLNMPVMNGLEMIEKVRMGTCSEVPIIMLTTEGTKELIDQGKSFGLKGWLVKPIKPELLLAVIVKIAG